MKRANTLILILLVVGCTSSVVLDPGRYEIMDPTYASDLRSLCSRPGPPAFEGTWVPTDKEVRAMEAEFRKLLRLRSKTCCIYGERVYDINLYYRQYFGLVVQGRRLIYINATRHRPTAGISDGCDGGSGYWGVLYDPSEHRFFQLAFNGEA